MNVERRHLPPSTNSTKMSAATSTPQAPNSSAHRAATNVGDAGQHCPPQPFRQLSNWSVRIGYGDGAVGCFGEAEAGEHMHSSHRASLARSVSRWLERLRFTRWYPFDDETNPDVRSPNRPINISFT